MKNILDKQNAVLRKSFSELARHTFEISFEEWYQKGCWTEKYLPYSICENGAVIANASANLMKLDFCGEKKNFIQIGTVMTRPDCRGRGLSRKLITEILCDWTEKCDGIYLFANSSVLGFYPRFGFERADEFVHSRSVAHTAGDFRRLDMSSAGDVKLLQECYARSNPFSALSFENNFGLLMFYCIGFLKDCIYYSESLSAAAVAEYDGGTLFCHDIFGGDGADLSMLLNALAAENTTRAVLGFTPKAAQGFTVSPLEGDDFLFVLKGRENPFRGQKLRFPSLSHA